MRESHRQRRKLAVLLLAWLGTGPTAGFAQEHDRGDSSASEEVQPHCLLAPDHFRGIDVPEEMRHLLYAQLPLERLPLGHHCYGLFADGQAARGTLEAMWQFIPLVDALEPHPLTRAEHAELSATLPVFFGSAAWIDATSAPGVRTELLRARTRDLVVVFHIDYGEGEPSEGLLWVLDGPTSRIYSHDAWSFALAPDEATLVFGRGHRLVEVGSILTDHQRSIAEEIGIDPAAEKEVSFQDGFIGNRLLVQPIRIDLGTGRVEPLPLVGGGTLISRPDGIFGLPRPFFFEHIRDTAAGPAWLELNTEEASWLPVPEGNDLEFSPGERTPTVGFDVYDGETTSYEELASENGVVLARTRDGRLGLLDIAGGLVQAARLPPTWSR